MSRLRWSAWAPAVLVTALASGCSVGTQAAPVPLPGGQLPKAVRVAMNPTVGIKPGPTSAAYFLDAGHLAPESLRLSSGDPIQQALAALVSGPDRTAAEPLSSALPASVNELSATVTGGIATVNVPETLERLGAHNEVLAVAQIVFTVTAQPGITAVRLTAGGQMLEVPTGSGQLVARPVTRQDYAALAPRPSR